MLNIGDTLQQGRYRVNRQLGTGGMATVYEVFDRRLQAKFALKEAFARTAAEQTQFEYEAQLLAQLSHPNLPRVIDYFSERGAAFLVMELVPGDDLETILQRQGQPFDVGMVAQWADQLLDALSYLHQQQPPVIHRDIKPPNLKIDGTGRIKLLDFGIAKQQIVGSPTVTAAQAVSLEYSPVEQFSTSLPTDARSDIYALGATIYYVLTNHHPTPALYRTNGQALPGPRTFNPVCPPTLAQVILRAMALKPEDRFQTAAEFRMALQQTQSPQPTAPVPSWSSRTRWVLSGAGGLIVLLLGFWLGSLLVSAQSATGVPLTPTGQPSSATNVVIASVPPAGAPSSSPQASAVASPDPSPVTPSPDPSPAASSPPPPPPTETPAPSPANSAPPAPVALSGPVMISRTSWGADPPTGANGQQQPRRMTLAHDGRLLSANRDVPAMLRTIQDIHQQQWVDIAWHYAIDLDGNIYEGHSPTDRTNTNYGYNTDGIIAIGVLGDYDQQTPSPQQIASIVNLMAWLCQQHNIAPSEIYPHRDFANQSPQTDPKITSPGRHFNVDDLRRQVTDRLAGK